MPEQVVVEVVAIEQLPAGANASRRALVRWSDGTESEALRWFNHEILFSEGDWRSSNAARRSVTSTSAGWVGSTTNLQKAPLTP
jgi:hypothetical protein